MVYIKDNVSVDPKTKNVFLARDGIYRYLGSELGMVGDDKIYNVRRTTKSVHTVVDAINNMGILPITINHPKNFLDLGNDLSYKKGGVGNCSAEVKDGVSYVTGKIISIDDSVKEMLNKGREVSLGSKAEIIRLENDPSADFEMDITEVNHLAVLDGKGRAGSSCSIKDGMSNKDFLERELTKMRDEEKKMLLEDVEKMMDKKMEEFMGLMESKNKKVEATDEEVKSDSEEAEAKAEAEEKAKVEAQDELNAKLEEARAEVLEQAQTDFKTACKFIDRGLIEAKQLEESSPVELIDSKLKELFDMEEIKAEERNGLINLALSDKKQFNDAWTGWGAKKEDKTEEKQTKKSFSIFK